MNADELIASLHKLHFFKGYTKEAVKRAEERVRQQYDSGMSGPHRQHFERFPGFALNFITILGEWDFEPYEPLVEIVAQNSFGMFLPEEITDERDEEEGTATLSFSVEGQRYSATVDDSDGWVPQAFLERIEQAFHEHCHQLGFFETYWPEAGDACSWTICTKPAHTALVQARLLPGDPGEISGA